MKKVVITVMLLIIMVMLGINQSYAAENVMETQGQSELVEILKNGKNKVKSQVM